MEKANIRRKSQKRIIISCSRNNFFMLACSVNHLITPQIIMSDRYSCLWCDQQYADCLTYSLVHSAYWPLHFSIQRPDGENICSSIEKIIDLIGGETRAQSLCFSVQHWKETQRNCREVISNDLEQTNNQMRMLSRWAFLSGHSSCINKNPQATNILHQSKRVL